MQQSLFGFVRFVYKKCTMLCCNIGVATQLAASLAALTTAVHACDSHACCCRSTRLNEYSSRGHCIMTLQFETTPLMSAQPGNMPSSARISSVKKYGKLVLVDLAGSERLKVTHAPSVCHDTHPHLSMHESVNKHGRWDQSWPCTYSCKLMHLTCRPSSSSCRDVR